jgi:hypothetical protein
VPKIKTHKATAKRFRRTGTGKLVRMYQAGTCACPRRFEYRQIEVVEAREAHNPTGSLSDRHASTREVPCSFQWRLRAPSGHHEVPGVTRPPSRQGDSYAKS